MTAGAWDVDLLRGRDRAQVEGVVQLLRRLPADDLLGVYLHGSAVLGGLRATSDLDLLAVAARPLTDGERDVLLTLCRVWTTLATGDVVPKDVAAAWALVRLPAEHRPVVQRARRMYLEGWDEGTWPGPAAVRSAAEALVRAVQQTAPA